MKKIICLSLIAGIFLAACSTGKNGMFTKRKYTKGIFVDAKGRASEPKENDLVKNTASKTARSLNVRSKVEPVAAPEIQNEEAPVLTADAQAAAGISFAPRKTVHVFEKSAALQGADQKEAKITVRDLVAAKKAVKKMKSDSKKAADGASTILLVILCLFPFINLIAVFLKDGGITANFWVTLILDILFLLPGIIFALLVVLDVVDLG